MRKALVATLAVLALAAAALGQSSAPSVPSATKSEGPKAASLFLLDPSRFKIQHTLSTSFASIGGRGILTNMYLANIQYQIANPLDIRVSLGFANSQGSLFGPKRSASAIIPGFELHYHPSNSFDLIVNYQQYPAGYLYRPGFLPFEQRR